MATLKDHQQAMVDLLASGSGIPASASRLAHAMHDVLGILLLQSAARENSTDIRALFGLDDATTPGLNDKALAADVEACRKHPWQKPDVTIRMDLYERARAAERRVKELENTVNQLRARVAKLKADQAYWYGRCLDAGIIAAANEQAGCRKDDTQVVDAISKVPGYTPPYFKDAKSCIHNWQQTIDVDFRKCVICGAVEDIYQ